MEVLPVDSRPSGGLSQQECEILECERQWWKHPGAKEQAILVKFGLSATRYYQQLNTLIDRPAALEFDPLLVTRLRRMRSARPGSSVRRITHLQ